MMDYIEANAWLKGERSMRNLFVHNEYLEGDANVLTAQADAAMTQQAYWIARAKSEKLTF